LQSVTQPVSSSVDHIKMEGWLLHQPHLKINEPNIWSIKSLLADLGNHQVESRVRCTRITPRSPVREKVSSWHGHRNAPLCHNVLPGLGKKGGRAVVQTAQSILSERQNTEKGWPWVTRCKFISPF